MCVQLTICVHADTRWRWWQKASCWAMPVNSSWESQSWRSRVSSCRRWRVICVPSLVGSFTGYRVPKYIGHLNQSFVNNWHFHPTGTLTVEQIYQDRDRFASLVREVAAPDVGRMGIEILSFTIKVWHRIISSAWLEICLLWVIYLFIFLLTGCVW